MKKLFWLFSFLFLVSLPVTVQAQEPAKTTVSAEDIRQLGEQVKALKSIVADEPKPEPKPEAKPPEKTMADVSDKALDMLGGAVGTVSETLKKLGPEVWRIMILQQYAEAATMVIGPLFMLIASLIAMFALRKPLTITEEERRGYDHSDMRIFKHVVRAITYFVPCLCALICAIQFSSAIAMIINPEYYALKDLLGLMTGK
jgi:hypothetical protein